MVPMNVRNAGDTWRWGTGSPRCSSTFRSPPPTRPSATGSQVEEAETLKSGTQHEGSSLLLDLGNHMPPVLHSFVARSLFATRLFNVTVTNVPGPQVPLYYFGSQDPGDLAAGADRRLARHRAGRVQLRRDPVFFCLNVDRDTCRDVDVLTRGIESSLAELRELAAPR